MEQRQLPVSRGVRAIRRLLGEQNFDLRCLDVAGFRHWLERQLVRWRRDSVFSQRAQLRDLRRANPQLATLERQLRRAAAADAASPHSARLRRLEQELTATARAIAGLSAAWTEAAPAKRPALAQKREHFQARQQALLQEQADLIQSSPERQTLLQAAEELTRCRAAIGLDREEALLATLLKQQGRRSGHSGGTFEQLARTVTRSHILPELKTGSRRGSADPLRVLQGVTLGAARTEFDLLVVRTPRVGGQAVEVLAVVEAKRNINDLAHGFRQRQENLAWLTGGRDLYDPHRYRTGYFRTGHFDRPVPHDEGDATFLFDRDSFRHFHRDGRSGLYLERLYFVTRAGPLWGVGAAALGRISYRVATDPRWRPEDDVYLDRLLCWCRSLTEPIETPEVLRLYAQTPARARQVLLVGR